MVGYNGGKQFFDTIDHEWLVEFLEQRIGDRRVPRLILIWLSHPYLEQRFRARLKARAV